MLISSYNKPVREQGKECIEKAFDEVCNGYEATIKALTARVEQSGLPVLKTNIEQCRALLNVTSFEYFFKQKASSIWSSGSIDDYIAEYSKNLDVIVAEIEARHANNLPSIESNKVLVEKLTALFKAIGLRDSYREIDYKSRKKYPQYIDTPAGWVKDLQTISTSDGYESAIASVAEMRKGMTKFAEEYRATKLREQAQKESEQKKLAEAATKERALGVILARQGLDLSLSGANAIAALIRKNKYLYLAHYLLKNRNDWTDGASYAECGLNGFSVGTDPRDKEIFDEISGLCNDFEGDGRVFRDCLNNYDSLFAIVAQSDPTLYADYTRLCALFGTDSE